MHAVTTTHTRVRNLVLSALMLAVAYVLPFFTGNIPQIGSMLLPMHLPTLLCGFLCGGPWGAAVGFLAPLLRSFYVGMPKLYPTAVAMAVEMAVYGLVAGVLYRRLPGKGLGRIYVSLVAAMLSGRVVWGITMALITLTAGSTFPMSAFVAGAFANAVPGIILQLVAIPAIVFALERAALISRT